MFLSPNFQLEELVFSQTAARLNLDNTPSPATIANLTRVAEYLEFVRHELGNRPLLISSGYRSPAVNAAVGGANNSAHLLGLAVDFTCPRFGPPLEVAKRLATITGTWRADQIIFEFGRWVHLGLARTGVAGRGELLSIMKAGEYSKGLHAA